MEPSIDLGEPAGQILLVVFFLIPGLIATWVLERLEGRTPLSSSERLFRAISWSVLIYLLASPWLVDPARRLLSREVIDPFGLVVRAAVLIFLAPVVLGVALALLRRWVFVRSAIGKLTSIHPAPTAWDFAFAPASTHFVRVKLRTGEMVGGYFGGGSFASAYPEAHDLFLQEAWSLNAQGAFVAPVDGTQGILLRAHTIERVELLEVGEADGT